MVRAPCCEKMGLKKGSWTPEEDRILISHIEKYSHSNWRALPKQAGLLRCGKSCRLRWTNYLRPDIKIGNFTKEEEETIINMHEIMGNRWSAIAARLSGRIDNEIKNVWHTHLKKRLRPPMMKCDSNSVRNLESIFMNSNNFPSIESATTSNSPTMSPQQSFSTSTEFSSSMESFHEIDESFQSDELLGDQNSSTTTSSSNFRTTMIISDLSEHQFSSSFVDNDMEFWYGLFVGAGGLSEF